MTEFGPGDVGRPSRRRDVIVAVAATLLAAFVLVGFLALSLGGRDSGTVSVTFLFVLPAALSAFASYLSDLDGTKGFGHYLKVPSLVLAGVLLIGIILFKEGLICLVILAPIWWVCGFIGSFLMYKLRQHFQKPDKLFSAALLLLPVLVAQAEAATPEPVQSRVVRRETVVRGTPEQVWPLLLSVPAIRPHEGRWNIAQDLLRIPRPTNAITRLRGKLLVREAAWGEDISFEEHLTRVDPGRVIEWAFVFPDDSVAQHTDRHISPDGARLQIERGAYRLSPAPGGGTLLRLETSYRIRSRINGYGAWWGELLLGGIQKNVLGIVEDRANSRRPGISSNPAPRRISDGRVLRGS